VVVLIGLLLGLTGAGIVLAEPAEAHATVVSSSPTDGARLPSAPHTVSITFDEQVGLGEVGYLHVVNQSGHRVDVGAAFHPGQDGRIVTATLAGGLGEGIYTESYRVISADSHPVAGTVRFAVGDAVLTPQAVAGSPVDRAVGTVFVAVRVVGYAGFAMMGGLWILLTVWPAGREDSRARRIVWTGLAMIGLGALGQMFLQGPYSAGRGLASVAHLPLLQATLNSGYGELLLVRLALLLVIGIVLRPTLSGPPVTNEERLAFLGLVVTLAWTYSALGHPDTTNPSWLSISADSLHLLAMAGWLGGLFVLLVALLPRRNPVELTYVLPRFSRVAYVCVALLALTGAYAGWRGIGTLKALTTPYALLVGAKVVLFAGILVVGNLSRVAAGRALERTVHAPARIRRSILLELVVAAAVLVVTATLVAQPRGREALADEQLRPVSAAAALGGGRTVRLTIDPGHHGTVTAYVEVSAGPPLQRVRVTAALPSAQLGPIPLTLVGDGPDRYSASTQVLPVAGAWTFTIIVSTSEFDATTTDLTLHLS
jgi:copper transport protein